jgi:PhnB protein
MLKLTPYLSFDGHCEQAFKLYEQCLGGKITFMQTYGDSPMAEQTPTEWRTRVTHATLSVGDQLLQGSDSPSGPYQKPQGFSIAIALSDAAEAERIFKAPSEKGKVQMPLEETFWALRFGYLIDQFGVPWMINCEKSA